MISDSIDTKQEMNTDNPVTSEKTSEMHRHAEDHFLDSSAMGLVQNKKRRSNLGLEKIHGLRPSTAVLNSKMLENKDSGARWGSLSPNLVSAKILILDVICPSTND